MTGMDPAISGGIVPIYPALTQIHAKFVDIIHTDAGWIGESSSVGHIDFWVNDNGTPQYKCSLLNIFDLCNSTSQQSTKILRRISNKIINKSTIIGKKCSGSTFTKAACTGTVTASMGFYADQYASNPGNYYVATKTNGIPPYSVQ
ncbi:hypothetical protein PVAND_015216 [Polypedilum vanderplanki]|uniref:Lipase domain-containing protein n=1 Tax=Polypedilum vanderplanki TaxID=319348 RepID=A0A9J6BBI4_POLVA|nr:hypothetical protein PVAND_015216 [Polypedilum vanderplanki]